MSSKLDIVIPSKDRALQLHLLLESLNSFVKGIASLVITWQGSTEEFQKAYLLLKKRVEQDSTFAHLRSNTEKIIFLQRDNLKDVYTAYQNLSEAAFVLPLVDDDIFLKAFDFQNNEAIKQFVNSYEIIACNLRVGLNLSSQVPRTFDTGLSKNGIKGHASSIDSYGVPRLDYPLYSHNANKVKVESYKYCQWDILFNQNIPHWSLVASVTGQVYEKSYWLRLLDRYGKDNFLKIEAKGQANYIEEALGNWKYLYKSIKKIDDVVYILFFKRSKIYRTHVLADKFLKYFSLRNLSKHQKQKLVSPFISILYNISLGFSNHRENVNKGNIEGLNKVYLSGNIIDMEDLKSYSISFPTAIIEKYEYKKYI